MLFGMCYSLYLSVLTYYYLLLYVAHNMLFVFLFLVVFSYEHVVI